MSELKCLHEDQDHDHVHHGGVKLETEVRGTDVEYCTEDALEDHAEPQGVEDAVLLNDASGTCMVNIGLIV